jgi:hypothetical protein
MMFLESPSPFAPLSKWEDWAERLKTLNPRDKTVVAEKKYVQEVIELRRNPQEIEYEPFPL